MQTHPPIRHLNSRELHNRAYFMVLLTQWIWLPKMKSHIHTRQAMQAFNIASCTNILDLLSLRNRRKNLEYSLRFPNQKGDTYASLIGLLMLGVIG